MRRFVISLLLLAFTAVAGTSLAQPSSDALEWLLGDWKRETTRGTSVESWKRVSPHTLEGTVSIAAGDSTRLTEHMWILWIGSEIFYVAKPQQNPFPTSFKLTETGEMRLVFENPAHDFPQRIIYSRDADRSLRARIEGMMDGETRAVDFVFQRAN